MPENQLPCVSILIAVYSRDRPDFFDDAMSSITVLQTRQPDEVVLVEDGPLSEELRSVVTLWQERLGSRLKRVVFPENRGLGAALKAGLEACRYPFVVRMDSDDLALPSRVAEQLDLLTKRSEVDICGGQAEDIDAVGNILNVRIVPCKDFEIKKILWANPVVHPSVMFRRDRILALGSYNPNSAHRQEDFDLWVRAAEADFVFHNLDKKLIRYRVLDTHFAKNSPSVAFRRFRIALRAANKFDRRLYAYITILYPLVRSVLPFWFANWIHRYATKWDPRRVTEKSV